MDSDESEMFNPDSLYSETVAHIIKERSAQAAIQNVVHSIPVIKIYTREPHQKISEKDYNDIVDKIIEKVKVEHLFWKEVDISKEVIRGLHATKYKIKG